MDRLAPMSRWLVQLQGERLDLEELPKWFPSGDVHAVEEREKFFITGPTLDGMMDADAVLRRATEALNEFSAVIFLLWDSFRKPNIGQVIREDDAGKRNAYIFVAGIASGRSKASGVLVDAGGAAAVPATTQAQDLLWASHTSPNLREALNVWADPIRSWGRLYRIVEEIKKHFGKPVDEVGLCSRPDLIRFARTANTAEAAGLDARHASGLFKPPDKPMSLNEATSFVSRLLLGALRK